MKLLLTDPSVAPGPTTLLVWDGEPENGRLETIAGQEASSGFVTEGDWSGVHRALVALRALEPDPRERRTPGILTRAEVAVCDRVASTARLLLGFENGSPVAAAWESADRVALDISEASHIDRVPDLAEGDRVVVAAPASKEFVNTRGRVLSFDGHGWVRLELDPGDLDRVDRSEVGRYSTAEFFPRHCLEPAHPRSWRRRLDRWTWRLCQRRSRRSAQPEYTYDEGGRL